MTVLKCCLIQKHKVFVQFLTVSSFHSICVCVCVCVPVVLGTIRSAVGSAQLLISQKFEQFRGLCNENLVSGSVTSFFHWMYFHPPPCQVHLSGSPAHSPARLLTEPAETNLHLEHIGAPSFITQTHSETLMWQKQHVTSQQLCRRHAADLCLLKVFPSE